MRGEHTFERKPWRADGAVAEVLLASSGIPTTTTLVEVGISPNDMESKLDSLPPPQICKVNTV